MFISCTPGRRQKKRVSTWRVATAREQGRFHWLFYVLWPKQGKQYKLLHELLIAEMRLFVPIVPPMKCAVEKPESAYDDLMR